MRLPSLTGLAAFLVLAVASPGRAAEIEFNRDIRPILADTCFACHGPDSAARKGDLRLDRRDDAIAAGALAPGKPDASGFIERIFSTDPETIMPPPASHKVLKPEQKELLKRWVESGAEYQPHWSFIAPTRPSLPTVKSAAWARNPIDAFILARLEAAGLTPAEEADRRTLARRVSLDLTGLPPAPELVEAFVNDKSESAYETLVDKLLATPQWGEHRARYWLDYARYADSHGIHFDNFREMWTYRDNVIESFNKNTPFDQFTIEQLAGDLLPNRTLEQQIASGFNRCNITTNEGGAIAEEYLVLYARDRTETTAQVWLGMTAGCAVCHDHKFDPLSQKEFYSLAAFFNNTTQNAMDGNIKDTPPIIPVAKEDDRPRLETIQKELPEARNRVVARKQEARPLFDEWVKAVDPQQFVTKLPTEGLHFQAPLSEGKGAKTKTIVNGVDREIDLVKKTKWEPGHVSSSAVVVTTGAVAEAADVGDFEKDQAFTCAAWVKMPANDGQGAMVARMDDKSDYRGWDFWIEGRKIGTHIVSKWPGDALKVVSTTQIPANEWSHVAFSYDGSGKAAGVKIYINGLAQPTGVQADGLQNTIKTAVPFKIGQRHTGQFLPNLVIQDLRIYQRPVPQEEMESLARSTKYATILAKPADQRTPAEVEEVFAWWLGTQDDPYRKLTAAVADLEREDKDIRARGTIAHVMQEKTDPAMAFVLFRGDYDKRRDQVTPATPAILPAYPDEYPKNRLGLAQWLLRPENPLTARVTVNRCWQELFGTGLVRTAGDFGVTGDQPSHPELLDWLAVEFREQGWDLKRLYKLMVMSATYRQAAVASAEKIEKDPANRLLARGPRFRMDAEMVRDYALASSGLLSKKIGGPSVKPYMPDGVWEAVAMIGSNTRDYRRDTGESLYRRSMYTFWKRSAPPAQMDIFNAPSRETCAVRRDRTNTPLQALMTLNDEQFVEAARHLAQRTLKEGGDSADARLDYVARRVLARPLRADEIAVVRPSLDALLAFYQSHPDDAGKLITVGESPADKSIPAADLAGWTMLINELMNLDEVLVK
jgi:hypothetical protein